MGKGADFQHSPVVRVAAFDYDIQQLRHVMLFLTVLWGHIFVLGRRITFLESVKCHQKVIMMY